MSLDPKNKKKIIIAIAVIGAFILLALPKLIPSGQASDLIEKRDGEKNILAVRIKVISPQDFDNKILVNGTISSNEEVDLQSEIPGKIVKILFIEGARVKKNQLLVKINDSELQAQLKKLEFRRQLAEEKEFRQKALLEREGISRESYDAALNELNTIRADIELLQAQLDKTEIKAPFDGIVGLRSVSVGAYITPSTKIAALQANNPVKIDFSIPQKYYNLIKPGSEVKFRISSLGKLFKARVYAVEPKIDPSTRTIQIRALCPNDNGELMPGSFAEIELFLEKQSNAILVPSESIIPDIQGERVFLYEEGIAKPRKVMTGLRTEKDVQIIEGLSKGDSVIVSGIIQLRPNLRVGIESVTN